jgi:uncharacterized protein (DUF1778 family)
MKAERARAKEVTETRLSIRTNAAQKASLLRAAEARHTTISHFVLEASLNEANRVLADEQSLAVSVKEYDWLCRLMDEPARDLTELKALMDEVPAWDV